MRALSESYFADVSGGHPIVYAVVTIVFFYEGKRLTKKVIRKMRK